MRIGLYVIGDEILSGRREDKHLSHMIAALGQRGLSLAWAQFLPDDREALADAFQRSLAGTDLVFSCGGIGATPDDHTRQAAAQALDAPLVLHPQARDLIAQGVAKRGVHDLSTPEGQRILMMGEFPVGAQLIPNPFNQIPGFRVNHHHFVPGFPVMAWPMIDWTLDTHYAHLFNRRPWLELSVLVFEMRESTITPLMQALEAAFPQIKTFSLPSVGDGQDGRPNRRHIELGVKGDPGLVQQAFPRMLAQLKDMGAEWQVLPQTDSTTWCRAPQLVASGASDQ
jgi:molybdopterin-biosynthesis enzyme MoeA-like protein